MEDIISRYLRRWASTEFVWGQTDCTMVLADYILEATGKDPAAPYRGTYSDRAGALEHGGLSEGLLAVFNAGAERAGLRFTASPERGDVGALAVGDTQFGGLFLGARWAVKSPDGLLFLAHPTVLAAWSVKG